MPEPMYDRNGVALCHGDCAGVLPALSVKADLIATSPPYDAMREYGGQDCDFESCAAPIANALTDGGVMRWNTNDMVVDGGYSGSGFDAALWFMREAGLRLYDRIIVSKSSFKVIGGKRWLQNFDYCFVFSKGKPRVFNPIEDRANVHAGQTIKVGSSTGKRYENGSIRRRTYEHKIQPFGRRATVWNIFVGAHPQNPYIHPAAMAMELAQDLVRAYSAPGGLVLDPFSGSATTAYAAQMLGRRSVGIEIHKPYIEDAIAKRFLRQPLFAGAGD